MTAFGHPHGERRHRHPGRYGASGGRYGGPRRHYGGRGRAARGDVRVAVLLLLDEEPMHGYQLMQAIADRTDGRWTPSPGAIYPTLNQLEDEGLVTVTAGAGRKLAALTAAGRRHVEEGRATWPDPFDLGSAAGGTELRGVLEQVHDAARQVARTGTEAQRAAAQRLLADTRRALYLLLAEGPAAPADEDEEHP